ncbi:MAG: ZIP family metal transporter [Ruminococcus sp.]|jgi:ZIP family zinc transporter|nr:ZIP family metal transporter [Ruminococcus sp.]
MENLILFSLIATLGTWAVNSLGAATVLFFRSPSEKTLNLMLGFASGVMIAASFWSLLEPSIALAEKSSALPAYVVATSGFLFGAVFMWISDKVVTFSRRRFIISKGSKTEKLNRVIMLVLSITFHNIPEGLAIGVAFGSLQNTNFSAENLMCAITIALGIGIQNFPEGAAVSLPLRREGCSRLKSFLIGSASGIVEPIAGVIGAVSVVYIKAILPYALAFAAGCMILVAVHELIPECQQSKDAHPYFATMGIVSGFAAMMLLDVMLG